MEGNRIKTFVVGILTSNSKYLVERRHENEEHFGGMLIFPGGLIEGNESADEALIREMKEELDIEVRQSKYLGEFYYEDGHRSRVYLIDKWTGEPVAKEAESIMWIEEPEELSNEFDRKILRAIIKGN